jgi:hypothetical protein
MLLTDLQAVQVVVAGHKRTVVLVQQIRVLLAVLVVAELAVVVVVALALLAQTH